MYDKKQDRIDNCGKRYKWAVGIANNTAWRKAVLYCGYINDCKQCKAIERSRRKKQIVTHLESARNLFRCEVDESDWNKLYQKLKRDGISFMRNPQKDSDKLVIVAGKDPNHKSFAFTEESSIDIIQELTSDDNLFPSGKNRSSSPDWSLTPPKKEEVDISEETIQINTMEPRFSNNTSGYKVPYDDLYDIVKACNTWSGGRVTKDNAQEYITNSTGTLIALHLAAGYTWNMEESRIVKKTIKVSDIEKWAIHSVEYTKRAYYGKDEDGNRATKDTFYGKDEQILAVIHGVVDIPDRIAELEKFQADSYEDQFDVFFPK